jgi:hypothetical protein
VLTSTSSPQCQRAFRNAVYFAGTMIFQSVTQSRSIDEVREDRLYEPLSVSHTSERPSAALRTTAHAASL